VADLSKISLGAWVEPDKQEIDAVDSLNKGIEDALAETVAGDRSKARNALASGSTTLNGLDFTIYLGNQILEAGSLFDRKHSNDPMKQRTVCNEGFEAVKAAESLLKETPDPDKEKQVKKLEDQIKATLKKI